MSLEVPGSFDKQEFAQEEKFAQEDRTEMVERFPTVESIVDPYRRGELSLGEVEFRFPEKGDQETMHRLAAERNAADDAAGISA